MLNVLFTVLFLYLIHDNTAIKWFIVICLSGILSILFSLELLPDLNLVGEISLEKINKVFFFLSIVWTSKTINPAEKKHKIYIQSGITFIVIAGVLIFKL